MTRGSIRSSPLVALTVNEHPLIRLNAAELSRRIAAREVSSREVVEAMIARVERVNPAINALVVPLFEQAQREAAAADERQARGESLAPLHGVPVTVKECFHVAGTASTIGLTHRRELLKRDGVLVRRLRDAGAILLGKTNIPQLMIWHETDNPVYGRTNNPWNLDRSPGGSTGGEAALIAAGGSPLGLGSDLGGSIRLPSHFCGLHGLKPTSHRLPRSGITGNLRGFETIPFQPGPMARRVEDLALAMRVLTCGNASPQSDCDVPPVPLLDFRQVAVSGLRIGVWLDDGSFTPSPAIRRLVAEAGQALTERGAVIEPFEFSGVREVVETYISLAGADGGADAHRLLAGSVVDRRVKRMAWLAGLNAPVRKLLAKSLQLRGQQRLAELLNALGPRSADAFWQLTLRMKHATHRFVEDWQRRKLDALIMPVHALPAMPHRKAVDLLAAASYAYLANFTGVPAGAVSLSRVRADEESDRRPSRDLVIQRAIEVERGSTGLPIGVQVLAAHWREDVVLAVMAALEETFQMRPDFPAGRT